MEIVGVVVLLLALFFAFKVVGVVFKLFLWALVLGIGYWLLAPHLGLPALG